MRTTALPASSVVLFMLLHSPNVKAESQFSITPTLLHFDYTEFSKSGVILDNETGWIPGVQLHLNKPLNEQWTVGFELTAYSGSVDYDGNTQTTTEETIIRFGASIETPLTPRTELVFGAKHNEWQRDIQDNNALLGPYEVYRWWEISVGIKNELWVKETQSWQVEATLLRTINPTIHVDLSKGDFGSTDLDQGADWGGKIQLSWKYEDTSNWQYGFNIFYEAWNFGRSNSKATTGGTNTGIFTEPYSETRLSGISMSFYKKY